jgi:hypothetical protein
VRAALLAIVLTLALAVAASTGAAAGTTPSVRVTFTGSATGHFRDAERWILLSSNECYLRRMRDQKTSVTWNVGFAGGRALSVLPAASVKGAVRGTEVKDSCDDVAEELPPDAPADWLQSLTCDDPLGIRRPGKATWANGVLRVQAPVVEVAKNAVCTALPRSEELNARIALPTSRVARLRRGAQIRIAVGSAKPVTGTYDPTVNCFHIAKPYDGYRSLDQCVDTLQWSGTVTITRL